MRGRDGGGLLAQLPRAVGHRSTLRQSDPGRQPGAGRAGGAMTSRLHFKASAAGTGLVVSPQNSASDGLELEIVKLPPGGDEANVADGKETLLVVLGGRIDVDAGGERWHGLGERANVFAGRATSVYLPPGTGDRLSSAQGAEAALFRAPPTAGGGPHAVPPDAVKVATRGSES